MSPGRASPPVAVITPVYNGADFLAEAMESVQAQTYESLVHVVLDNASTDDTAAVIERFKGGRVPVLAFRNASTLKQMDNWNTAFAHVPGEAKWLRLLCHDDTLEPESIAACVEAGEQDERIGLVGSDHLCFGRPHPLHWPQDQAWFEGAEAARRILRNESRLMAPQMLFRASLLQRRNPLFQSPISGWDMDACLALFADGQGYAHVSHPLCMTRVHENSISARLLDLERLHYAQRLIDLERHGPKVFSAEELAEVRRMYRRYYFRKLVRWSVDPARGPQVTAKHLAELGKAEIKPDLRSILDSLLDWPISALGLRARWNDALG